MMPREVFWALVTAVALGAVTCSAYGAGKRSANLDRWQDSVAVLEAKASRLEDSLTRVGSQVDTLIQRVETRLPPLIYTRRDTLHLHDTVWVRQYVEESQTALAECRDLAAGCALFRRTADSTMRALRAVIAAAVAKPEKSCTRTALVVGGLSLTAGAIAGAYVRGQ